MIKNSRRIFLNSADRASGDSSNFSITVNMPPHETFTHVCLLEASIPKSYYLVQAGYNTFTLVELGVNSTVTITPACYSATKFVTTLSAALTAASTHGWTYTMSFDSTTGKYTYTVANNTGQPSFVTTTNVYEQLGFDANSTHTFVGNTLTSANVVKMQAEDALYIHSDICVGNGNDILQEVYTGGVPDFSMISYKCMDWQVMSLPISTNGSTSFRFAITDEFNRVMNLNGQNWVMTLLVFTRVEPLLIIGEARDVPQPIAE